jgi:hypothetical protein
VPLCGIPSVHSKKAKKGIEIALYFLVVCEKNPLMRFEFDPAKSARTKADPNRQIDFIEAQAIWRDADRLEIPLPFSAETRWAIIGKIAGKHWTLIFTRREDRIRIISVRRSHPKEIQLYQAGI